jgi:hypothetical protein
MLNISAATYHVMDLKSIVEVAAGLAGVVSTSLELQRRVKDYQLDARGDRLRARAEKLAKFLQVQTQLHNGGADQQLTQQAISSTKAELDGVLKELVKVQQAAGAIKVDEMSLIRRWLLLFVPARRLAWILHFGFYFSVSFLVLSVFEFKAVSASRLVPVTVIVLEISASATIAVLLRYWALMEKRWAEGFRPNPSPMCRGLLWYGPASRRELIARAGLLFGLFQIGPFLLTTWTSLFRQALTFAQLAVTLIVFYAWNIAELSLANNPVEMKFPRNLRFLRWPHNQIAWFWTICFYLMAGGTIFLIKQVATVNIIPAAYRHEKFMHIGAIIGLMINFLLAYLLPMYALNRILLAQSEQKAPARNCSVLD